MYLLTRACDTNVQKDKMRKTHAALIKTNHAYSTYNYSNNVKTQQQNNRYLWIKTHITAHIVVSLQRERGGVFSQ